MARVAASAAVTLLVTALALVEDRASAARILGVFPHQGYSHHLVFLPYLRTLADRGHDVYVISNFDSAHPRITDLDARGAASLPLPNNNVTFANAATRFGFVDTVKCMFDLYYMARATEVMFDAPDVRRLLDDRHATFDLVIAEHFNSDLTLGFAAKYRVPSVLLSSCSLLPWTMSLVGQPQHVAFKPNMLSGLSARMNLGQRLSNAVTAFVSVALFRSLIQVRCRHVVQERLGVDVHTTNVSMVLANTHWTLGTTSSSVPAVREVGGMHILPQKKLPTEIQEFIDGAEHGVIYFCMGSLLRGETFPAEKRQMFLNVFKQIPQRVLWKWEGEELPGKTSDIMIRKWMPQRDILAHPNVKLFISHGGLLGTTEAVYEGVPILAMPMFGDQLTNMKAIQDKGVAEILSYGDLNEDDISTKIKSMLTNPTYKQKAEELSELFRDRPMSPLETAVYWTEYVIRHKGAPHLRSAAVGMPWYQYYLIDVLLVIFLALTIVCTLLYYVIFKVLLRLISKNTKTKQN